MPDHPVLLPVAQRAGLRLVGEIAENRLEYATARHGFHFVGGETTREKEGTALVGHALHQAQGHARVVDFPVGQLRLFVDAGFQSGGRQQGRQQGQHGETMSWGSFHGANLVLRIITRE